MNLIALPAFEDNYLWLLHDDARALVVDPGDAQPVQAALARLGLQLQGILVTHHHGDHTGGVAVLREATGAAVYGPAGERIPEPHHALRGGQGVSVLGIDWQVIDVPGHTAGHIAYYAPDVDGTPLLFCGDTLFSGGCGRLFEGTPAQMLASLDALAALPAATRVCCAHEYTLANLRFAVAVEPGNQALADYTRQCERRRAQGCPPCRPTLAPSGPSTPSCAAASRRWHRPCGRTRRPPKTKSRCLPPFANGRTRSDETPACAGAGRLCLAGGCARRPRKPAAAPRHARHTHGGCHPCRPAGCHARGGRDRTAQLQVAPLAAPADLWDRIRRGFAMPNLDSDLVRKQQQWYLSRPDYIERMVERSRLYLFHVVEELELRGMPTELALLPYIESAFNPQAVSSAKAAGMWQFMPGTGRDQLTQNVLRDERRSVLDSTRAALDYLQMLHDMFGDWHLALAAYNWGQGNVSKAIERNKAAGLPTGYLDLNMPAETRNYVPKLQAVKNIIANPTLFGAVLPDIGNHPFFDTVDITRDIDVEMAARLAEVRLEDFKALNPSQRKPIILAAGTPRSCCPGTTPPSSRRTWPPPTLPRWPRGRPGWHPAPWPRARRPGR
jgi:hydroxyacylglutathione hydrolase